MNIDQGQTGILVASYLGGEVGPAQGGGTTSHSGSGSHERGGAFPAEPLAGEVAPESNIGNTEIVTDPAKGSAGNGLAPDNGSDGRDTGDGYEEGTTPPSTPRELSDSEKRVLQDLKARDREVRAHELAHKAAGGSVTGPINFEYTNGPDGKRYVSGGEVSVDTSEGRTPEETIRKMEQVRAAALAPANPSGADRAVAAEAAATEAAARRELAAEGGEVSRPAVTGPTVRGEEVSAAYGATDPERFSSIAPAGTEAGTAGEGTMVQMSVAVFA